MNTLDKNALIAQIAEAMGITCREDQDQLVRYLVEKWELDYPAISNQPAQKPKAPEGFTLDTCNDLPIAIRQSEVLGAVFCLEGKHFIFAFKSRNKMNLLEAKRAICNDKFGTIDGYHWIMPTVPMFVAVQKLVQQFNTIATAYGGDKIDRCEYLDTSMTDPRKIATLRLAMWAPWLD